MNETPIDDLLQRGKAAANSQNNALARHLLTQVVGRDPQNEQGWLWLSGLVDEPEHMRYCLERVLAINPANVHATAALRDFASLAPKPVATPAPISQSLKPTKPVVRRRPASMIEGAAVQTVVTQHSRIMWAYIALWCGIMALHVLLFKAGGGSELGFGIVASRIILAALVLAGLQSAAWAVLLLLLQRRVGGQTLPHTTLHSALSTIIWPSALAGLVALLVGGVGGLAGGAAHTVATFGRVVLLCGSGLLLINGLVRSVADPDYLAGRERSQTVYRALAVFAMLWAVALFIGWLVAGMIVGS